MEAKDLVTSEIRDLEERLQESEPLDDLVPKPSSGPKMGRLKVEIYKPRLTSSMLSSTLRKEEGEVVHT